MRRDKRTDKTHGRAHLMTHLARYATAAMVALLIIVPAAPAAVVVYEGFDAGNAAGTLNGKAGATSVGLEGTWDNSLGTGSNAYSTTGLTIGSGSTVLETVGGNAFITGTSSTDQYRISRGLSTTVTGTIYGSYLFQRTGSFSDNVGAVMVTRLTTDIDNFAEFSAAGDVYGTAAGGMKGKANQGNFNNSGSALSTNTTYIVLFSVTNLGGSSGSVAMNEWILTSDQFDYFRASDDMLTASELNAATTGAAATNVTQRGSSSYTPSGDYPRLTADDLLMLFSYRDAINLDEIRISNVSLTEATPLVAAVPTPAALPAGLLMMIVACCRRR